MKDVDNEMLKAAIAIDADATVTRYADDVYFSTNTRGLCRDFYNTVEMLFSGCTTPSLTINVDKTLYLSMGTRRTITGLFVDGMSNVSIGRDRKMTIKMLLYQKHKGIITPADANYARGLLAFIKDCEPDFYNRLTIKYGPALFSIVQPV